MFLFYLLRQFEDFVLMALLKINKFLCNNETNRYKVALNDCCCSQLVDFIRRPK